VHGPEGMVEAGVLRSRIDQMCEPGLFDAPQPLKQRMLNQVKNEWGPDMDQAVYRIIYELHFVHPAKIGKISARRVSLDTFILDELITLKRCTTTYG